MRVPVEGMSPGQGSPRERSPQGAGPCTRGICGMWVPRVVSPQDEGPYTRGGPRVRVPVGCRSPCEG